MVVVVGSWVVDELAGIVDSAVVEEAAVVVGASDVVVGDKVDVVSSDVGSSTVIGVEESTTLGGLAGPAADGTDDNVRTHSATAAPSEVSVTRVDLLMSSTPRRKGRTRSRSQR